MELWTQYKPSGEHYNSIKITLGRCSGESVSVPDINRILVLFKYNYNEVFCFKTLLFIKSSHSFRFTIPFFILQIKECSFYLESEKLSIYYLFFSMCMCTHTEPRRRKYHTFFIIYLHRQKGEKLAPV